MSFTEIERYHIDQSRRWLRSVAAANKEVELLREQRNQIIEQASGVSGIDYSGIKAHGIATDDQIPNALARIEKLTDKLNDSIANACEQVELATDAIAKIDIQLEREVLRMRYLMGGKYKGGITPFSVVAGRLGYSTIWVQKEDARGLNDLYHLIPGGYRDKIPSAI